jgi:hypothetical protein
VEWGYYRPFPTLGEPAEAADFVAARVAEGSDYLKFFLEDGTTTGMPTHALPAACVRPFVDAAHEAGRLATTSTPPWRR